MPSPGAGSVLAPQVQVIDGRIVVNAASLTVQAQELQPFTRVVTEDTPKLNSLTYMNKLSNERWSPEDTELFYKALSQFGTDFSLISQLFPGRQRRHLKNKFTRESKLFPRRIDDAIKASAGGTVASYQEMISMLRASGMSAAAEDGGEDATPAELERADQQQQQQEQQPQPPQPPPQQQQQEQQEQQEQQQEQQELQEQQQEEQQQQPASPQEPAATTEPEPLEAPRELLQPEDAQQQQLEVAATGEDEEAYAEAAVIEDELVHEMPEHHDDDEEEAYYY